MTQVDQRGGQGAPTAARMHDQIGAAGQGPRLWRVLAQQAHRLDKRLWLEELYAHVTRPFPATPRRRGR